MPYSKTDYMYVKGKTKWFRHVTPNEWEKWSHVLYMDQESLEKIRELQGKGLKNLIKKDEDGWYTTFSRPSKLKTKRGIEVALTPPEVIDSDGRPLQPGIMVGNGSDVTTKLECYQHSTPGGGKAVAARWMSSRIDNLIPYEKDRDRSIEEERKLRGLEDVPRPMF